MADTDADPRTRIRQLLLSGDNILKHRDDSAAWGRARERYERARAVASDAGLDDALTIIDLRLDGLAEERASP